MDLLSYNKRISLFNDAYYNITVDLNGISCLMDFVWNERTKRFHATLLKQDGTEIFTGVQINSMSIFPSSANMKDNDLLGLFILCPKDAAFVESDDAYRNWADYFNLMYQVKVPKQSS